MPITLKQAKSLTWNDQLNHDTLTNADGTPMRFRINGRVKTWKRDPNRIKVPLKHGLYDYGELTNGTFEGNQFTVFLDQVSIAS